jgi:cell division protein FtsA
VRYGLPNGLGGLVDVINSPTWCTASGLLLFGRERKERRSRSGIRPALSIRGAIGRIGTLFSDLL